MNLGICVSTREGTFDGVKGQAVVGFWWIFNGYRSAGEGKWHEDDVAMMVDSKNMKTFKGKKCYFDKKKLRFSPFATFVGREGVFVTTAAST